MATILETPPSSERLFDEFDNAEHYEIIDGVKVEMPPMSARATRVASDLAVFLTNYGVANQIGKAYPEMLIRLPLPIDRNRRPDVIFVPFSRWARDLESPDTNEWEVVPELCVEVVSPSDRADETMDKVGEYFDAGVRLVWVIYPRHRTVYVHHSLTSVRGLTHTDTLEGGDALPGFTLPLAELFPIQS